MTTTSIENDSEQPSSLPTRRLLRDRADYVLLVALVCLTPLLGLLCVDLWFRTDLKFFPLLPLAAVVLAARCGKLSGHDAKRRSYFTVGLFLVGGLLAVAAAILFSPWLALLAVTLTWTGWMLERMGDNAWYEVVGWTVPLWLMLVMPISDVSDASRSMEAIVARSSSSLLDMAGIPQLVSGDQLELRSGTISTGPVCRGVGSPYLLLALVLLLSAVTRRSFLVSTLSVLTVPLWAWFGAVVHVVVAVYLWEEQGRSLFGGYRTVAVQVGVVLVLMLMIRVFQSGLQQLLAPFTAYSSISNAVHKGFNWLVLWPAKDPLRKRKSVDEATKARRIGNICGHKYAKIIVGVAALALIGSGGYTLYQFVARDAAARIHPLAIDTDAVENAVVQGALPVDLSGMQQVDFQAYFNSESHFSKQYRVQWKYLVALQSVEITLEFPLRGFFPVEQTYVSSVSRIADARQSYTATVDGLGEVMLDEFVLLDELYGRSYLCYATFTLNGSQPLRTVSADGSQTLSELGNVLALQPTVFNARLFVEGTERLSDDERRSLRETLVSACASLAGPLRKAVELGVEG